jgi:glycosyltransferase involved in cell wall biosynthesis
MSFNPHSDVSSIRLLVVDEAMALGGVERMWLALVPELSKVCDKVVWMLPSHRLTPTLDALPLDSGVSFESFHWPRWNAAKLKSAIITRMASRFDRINLPYPSSYKQRLFNERLAFLIRDYRITHVLYSALFNQPFPEVSVPVFATVMDINYHVSWRDECFANLRVWAQKANHLFAISNFTKNEIERVCFEAYEKVIAIPLATDVIAVSGSTIDSTKPTSFYYPASFNPHKGHALLLKALLQLHNNGMDFQLTLTGGGTLLLSSEETLDNLEIEAARKIFEFAPDSFRKKIIIRGRVSAEDVDICFAHANLVVLPSCYEGFGLPLAEAVARGKRVVCADIPAFREQVALYGFKDAVTFVNGRTINAWATGIQNALLQAPLSPYSIEQLRTLFARRTWSNVAADYIRVIAS